MVAHCNKEYKLWNDEETKVVVAHDAIFNDKKSIEEKRQNYLDL